MSDSELIKYTVNASCSHCGDDKSYVQTVIPVFKIDENGKWCRYAEVEKILAEYEAFMEDCGLWDAMAEWRNGDYEC